MRGLVSRHKGKIGAALALGAAAAATYYGGPAAGDAVREHAPRVLEALGGFLGL